MQMSDRKFDELVDLLADDWTREVRAETSRQIDEMLFPRWQGKEWPLVFMWTPVNNDPRTWN
jgi:hypothetical protein